MLLKRLGAMCVILLLAASMPAAEGQAKPTPEETVRVAVDELIALLEAGKHAEFLSQALSAQDKEKSGRFDENGNPQPDYVERFKIKKAPVVLKALRATRGMVPLLTEENTVATFTYTEEEMQILGLPNRSMAFKLEGDTWRMAN